MGLVTVLAIVVLGGGRALIDYYVRSRHIVIEYKPVGQWSFGRSPVFIGCCLANRMFPVGESVCLGPVEVSWPNRLGHLYGW